MSSNESALIRSKQSRDGREERRPNSTRAPRTDVALGRRDRWLRLSRGFGGLATRVRGWERRKPVAGAGEGVGPDRRLPWAADSRGAREPVICARPVRGRPGPARRQARHLPVLPPSPPLNDRPPSSQAPVGHVLPRRGRPVQRRSMCGCCDQPITASDTFVRSALELAWDLLGPAAGCRLLGVGFFCQPLALGAAGRWASGASASGRARWPGSQGVGPPAPPPPRSLDPAHPLIWEKWPDQSTTAGADGRSVRRRSMLWSLGGTVGAQGGGRRRACHSWLTAAALRLRRGAGGPGKARPYDHVESVVS